METRMFCFLPLFQIHLTNLNNEDTQSQQIIEFDFDRMADVINDEVVSKKLKLITRDFLTCLMKCFGEGRKPSEWRFGRLQ